MGVKELRQTERRFFLSHGSLIGQPICKHEEDK